MSRADPADSALPDPDDVPPPYSEHDPNAPAGGGAASSSSAGSGAAANNNANGSASNSLAVPGASSTPATLRPPQSRPQPHPRPLSSSSYIAAAFAAAEPPSPGPGPRPGGLPAPPFLRANPSDSAAAAAAAPPQHFPAALSLYSIPLSRTFFLGPTRDNPLHAVSLHTGLLSGLPPIVMHAGPDPATSPVLVGVRYLLWQGGDMVVDLPARDSLPMPPLVRPAGPASASAVGPLRPTPGRNVAEPLSMLYDGFARRLRFAVEVGPPPGPAQGGAGGGRWRREVFEWRHTRGAAVQALQGRWEGWKLVRLQGPGAGARRQNETSDGREVVMVWTAAQMSLSKVAKFLFMGSGASGELGERFALMAVSSALAIWEAEVRQQGGRRQRW